MASLLFVSLLAANLIPSRGASLTNAADADDHPSRAALVPPPKFIPLLPAADHCCSARDDDDDDGPDLRRALFGDELGPGEGETALHRAVPPPPAGTIRGNVTLVHDARPLR